MTFEAKREQGRERELKMEREKKATEILAYDQRKQTSGTTQSVPLDRDVILRGLKVCKKKKQEKKQTNYKYTTN